MFKYPAIHNASVNSRQCWLLLPLTLLIAAAGLFLYYVNPLQQIGWLRCPVNLLTGLFCPGCGSLRAVHELLHGNLMAALNLNLLTVFAFPLLVFAGLLTIYRVMRGQSATVRIPPAAAWSVFWTIVFFTILRNLPLPLLHFLRP